MGARKRKQREIFVLNRRLLGFAAILLAPLGHGAGQGAYHQAFCPAPGVTLVRQTWSQGYANSRFSVSDARRNERLRFLEMGMREMPGDAVQPRHIWSPSASRDQCPAGSLAERRS